jgi:hypothetical protein
MLSISKKHREYIFSVFLVVFCLFICSGCVSKVGVEPPKGFIFDLTDGTSHIEPEFFRNFDSSDFNTNKYSHSASFYVHRIKIPIPFTFGLLSFGWGDMSTSEILKRSKLEELYYIEYQRLNILTIYEHYAVTAYGK